MPCASEIREREILRRRWRRLPHRKRRRRRGEGGGEDTLVQYVDHIEPIAFTSLKVILIVRWSDLHCAASKAHVNQDGIANDGNLTI